MDDLAGVLAWFSLIHLPPGDLHAALARFRRALAPDGILVVGFFDGDEVAAFDHKVVTAYRWPSDAFTEVGRLRRAGDSTRRPYAAIAARASSQAAAAGAVHRAG